MKGRIKLGVAVVGTLAVVSVTPPAQATTVASASATAEASACYIQHEGWFNGGSANFFRYVKVVNECGYSKRFCVDIPFWGDAGPYTLKAYERKNQWYGNASHPQGRGIYSC